MKIVHVCTDASGGGAANSMLNLHRALRELGHESIVLADSAATGLDGFERFPDAPDTRAARAHASGLLAWSKRSEVSNSHFSLDLIGSEISTHPAILAADVVHLHWTADFLSSRSLVELGNLGKPIIWTLHDMRPLTGGCHFSAGCEGFVSGCAVCPQLVGDEWNLTGKGFQAMQDAVARAQPVLVAPSQWMAGNARRSGITANSPCHLIPYGVDAQVFQPGSRDEARAALKLPSAVQLILIASHSFREKRKGGAEALAILEQLSCSPDLRERVRAGLLRLVCCGRDTETFSPPGWLVERPGFLDASGMVNAYRAADLLLFTSLEDNLPNVILEAMACGLPVAAHDIGGVPDLLGGDEHVGLLLNVKSVSEVASQVEKLLGDDAERERLAARARRRVEGRFSLQQQADQYLSLYSQTDMRPERRSSYIGEVGMEGALVALDKESAERLEILMRLEGDLRRALLDAEGVREKMSNLHADLESEKERRIAERITTSLQFTVGNLRYALLGRLHHFINLIKFHTGTARFRTERWARRFLDPLLYYEERHWMKLGAYHHYPPKAVELERFPEPKLTEAELPTIAIVTPSYAQGHFIEATLLSVLDQNYPALRYAVVDGGSKDDTPALLAKYRDRLAYNVSERDAGQSDALVKGFRQITGDIMAYLNADDTLMPGTLRFVGEYFAQHPDVDVIYGYRVIIDECGQEIGRWILPRHDDASTLRFDYIPQETLFWRRGLYEKVGGIDAGMRFAMDWDLILRFISAGARFERLPYFLGCFRAHEAQKSQTLHNSVGLQESRRLMVRELGENEAVWNVPKYHRAYRRRATWTSILHERGIRR